MCKKALEVLEGDKNCQKVTIPTDESVLKKVVKERSRLLRDARARLEEFLNETIADRKLREKIRFEAFRRLGIGA
jgi:hypothetical protein